MTKAHIVTTKVDSNSRIPSTKLQHYVDAAKANSHFAALSEDEQIAYVRLLIEAEEWAVNFGFKRTYLNSYLQGGIKDD
jgi:hypothetical protein